LEAGPEGEGGSGRSIERLLEPLSEIVSQESPHLCRLLEIFAQEARFGRSWLDASLSRLRKGDAVLEIGAGLMILSCQLVEEGYAVTALEPISEGFSDFSELQAIVLRFAAARGIAPRVLTIPVEEFRERSVFALAYSVNVMEHVANVRAALKNAGRAIKPGAAYRFICPNYLFPYEPHFDIPILFSKAITERLFKKAILGNSKVEDPMGLWRSLNWITVSEVLRAVRFMPGFSVSLGRTMFRVALERAIHDREFAARRAGWVRFLATAVVRVGLHRVTEYLPPHVHPIIDCTMTRADFSAV
jgi:SAM-dependent methyltransferase